MKKTKGFTLIELIVVIAIIGVLVAILVPAMMGWVLKSRVSTYNNNASEICTQLQIAMTDLDGQGITVGGGSGVTVKFSGVTCETTGLDLQVKTALETAAANLKDVSHSKWAAKIKDSTVLAVVYSENGYRTVGAFPMPGNKDYDGSTKDPSDLLEFAITGWN